MSEQTRVSAVAQARPETNSAEPAISISSVPKDTQLTILVGLLAVTIMLAALVTMPDGASPDSRGLLFIPHNSGLMGLHAQLRFVFAVCTMAVLLMLLHIVTLRWRTSHPLAALTREVQRISHSYPVPVGARVQTPGDPMLGHIAESFNRLLVYVGQQAALIDKRSSEVRDYQQGFAAVFADSQAPMCMIATDASIVDVNSAFCRLVGCSEDQLVQTLWTDLLVLDDPATAPVIAARLFDPSNYLASTDARLKARDNSHIRCNIVTIVVYDSQGAPRYAMAHVTSVENTRKLEEALQRTQEQVSAAVAVKDHFMATASFELRAPLTSAMLLAGSLERNASLPEDVRDDLALIREHLDTETRLMDELLDISAARDGTLSIAMAQTRAHECLKAACGSTENEILAKDLILEYDLAAGQDALVGDRTRLAEAFAGLIRCASGIAADDATITLRTSNPAVGSLRAEVIVGTTAVNGSELTAILRPLAGGEIDLSGYSGRTRLDLTMARAIIEAHEGAIAVHIDPTRCRLAFHVTLSVRTTSDNCAAPDAGLLDAPTGRGLHLLLVEDNHDVRSILQRVMSEYGHITAAATTAAEAIALAERGRFDLVICDICLPDRPGTELMPILRDRFGLKGIALSALNSDADDAASRAAGFEAHLTKPVRITALMDAVQQYCPPQGEPVASQV